MLQDIFVGVMCVVVAAVAVWGWWLENGPESKEVKNKNRLDHDGTEKDMQKEADADEQDRDSDRTEQQTDRGGGKKCASEEKEAEKDQEETA